jgi:hypothetical protein
MTTPFINQSSCKKFLLEHAAKTRAHKFTRVSSDTLSKLNEAVRNTMINHVQSMPSCGKTL